MGSDLTAKPARAAYRAFRAGHGVFVYDTSSNALVQVPEGVFEVLRSGRLAEATAAGRQSANVGEDAEWFAEASRRGMFKPPHRRDLSWLLQLDPREELACGLKGLTLGLSERCNFRCEYCAYSGHYQGHRVHGTRRMTWEVARKSLQFFLPRAAEGAHVSFYGGEPLMEWSVLENAVRHVRGAGSVGAAMPLRLMTNGSLLSPRRIDFLVEHDVGVTVSLDGPAAVHDRMRHFRGGLGTHQRVMDRISLMQSRAPEWYRRRVGFNCLLRAPTMPELLEVAEFFSENDLLRELPVQALHLHAGMEPRHAAALGLDAPAEFGMKDVVDAYLARLAKSSDCSPRGVLGSLIETAFAGLAERRIGPGIASGWPAGMCYPGKERLYVDAQGRFYICHHLDIADGEIGDLENGFDFGKVREALRAFVEYCDAHCHACWAHRLCSICAVKGKLDGRISSDTLAVSCNFERQRWEARLEGFAYAWQQEEAHGLAPHPASVHQMVERWAGGRSA